MSSELLKRISARAKAAQEATDETPKPTKPTKPTKPPVTEGEGHGLPSPSTNATDETPKPTKPTKPTKPQPFPWQFPEPEDRAEAWLHYYLSRFPDSEGWGAFRCWAIANGKNLSPEEAQRLWQTAPKNPKRQE